MLGVLWWAWVGYAWLTSVIDPEEGAVRLVIFAAMAALLVVSLCVPEAFGDLALTFAIAYGVVRAAHIALFLLASRDDPALRHSVLGLAVSTAIGVGLLVAASLLDGVAQGALWALALCPRHGRALLLRLRGLEAGAGALRRAPRADRDHRPRRVDRRDRRRRRGSGSTPGSSPRRCSASRWPRRCGGSTSTSSRWSPRGGWREPRRGASGTRWRATPTPTCTSRWSPGSCSSRSG